MAIAEFQFADNIYLSPTPSGAFYAISSPAKEPMRTLLLALLRQEESQQPITNKLIEWTGVDDIEGVLSLVQQAQSLAWIEGLEEPITLPDSGFATMVEILLESLSNSGKALLVDGSGCTIACSGFDDETAEMLSAFSTDLIAVQDRHEKRLKKYFGLNIHGWGAVDSSGSSRIGTWPIYIGDKRLLLTIPGEPRFNCPEFTLLIWSLVRRYFV